MKKILITGATGNIGMDVIKHLFMQKTEHQIIAGVRNIEKAKQLFKNYPNLNYTHFDFDDQNSFQQSLHNIDTVFLLRPPHIDNTDIYFKPLILEMKSKGIRNVIFLSVQGAEKSKIIPHNRIEKLIVEHQLNYVFLRPSYFMQNLTTTLWEEIHNNRLISLPAGNALFNWIDIDNIAEVAAIVLNQPVQYQNRAIELTGYENLNFKEVVSIINQQTTNKISYQNLSPFKFYSLKAKEGMDKTMILVMIMLHFLPRFQKPPVISDEYEKITGKKPTTISQFVSREINKLD